jgi:hypothetical protein
MVAPQRRAWDFGVGRPRLLDKACARALAGIHHTLPYDATGFAAAPLEQLSSRHGQDGNLEIDPVKEGPAEPRRVSTLLIWGARALQTAASAASTWARIRGQHQLKPRGVGDGGIATSELYLASLHRLSEGVEHRAMKLRCLVEEEDTTVREADRTWTRYTYAATDQCGR